ncbi:hypothetical protein V5799_010652 [Amblyomma americanum]|uniref:Uncharacterized protein n=1 Tax=Amblyomma americanum TaxID=6943 RepID=A0AAQ4EJ26_AMBAM
MRAFFTAHVVFLMPEQFLTRNLPNDVSHGPGSNLINTGNGGDGGQSLSFREARRSFEASIVSMPYDVGGGVQRFIVDYKL